MSKPEFVYVTYIETTPENLWEALTDSEFTKRYWFGTEVRSDWKVGSPLCAGDERHRPPTPAKSSKPTGRGGCPTPSSTSSWMRLRNEPAVEGRLHPRAHGKLVKLTLTHEGFAEGSKLLDGISRGWPAIISSLKSLLESGKALAIPPVRARHRGFE